MQVNSKPKKEGQKPLPPQVFNDEEYCGVGIFLFFITISYNLAVV